MFAADVFEGQVIASVATLLASGVKDAVGVAAEGATVYVATATEPKILAISGGAAETLVELDFTPTQMTHIGARLYLLSEAKAGETPARVFDAATGRVYFIPMAKLPAPAAVTE